MFPSCASISCPFTSLLRAPLRMTPFPGTRRRAEEGEVAEQEREERRTVAARRRSRRGRGA